MALKPNEEMISRAEAEAMAEKAASIAVENVMTLMKGSQSNENTLDFARALATTLAEIGNQGVGKQTVVPPAVLEARSQARSRMFDLIDEAIQNGVTPVYELHATVHLNDQLVSPLYVDKFRIEHRTRIGYQGVPNEAMQPAAGDKPAAAIYEAFIESIGRAPGTRAQLVPISGGRKGYTTPGGRVFEILPPISPSITNSGADLQTPAMGAGINPGLQVFGQTERGEAGRIVSVPILGTVAAPAEQRVN